MNMTATPLIDFHGSVLRRRRWIVRRKLKGWRSTEVATALRTAGPARPCIIRKLTVPWGVGRESLT